MDSVVCEFGTFGKPNVNTYPYPYWPETLTFYGRQVLPCPLNCDFANLVVKLDFDLIG